MVNLRLHSKNQFLTWNIFTVNNTEKTGLYEKNRVLCWILTNPKNHESKARVVKETWGSHCNILFFVSTESGTWKLTSS